MTVGELVTELAALDQSLEVVISHNNEGSIVASCAGADSGVTDGEGFWQDENREDAPEKSGDAVCIYPDW